MKKILQTSILCLLIVRITSAQSSFTGKPTYDIVTIQSGDTIGTIKVELFPTIAPLHTAYFDSLVNVHFFDSTAFHRVIPGFMIQGGDPNSRHGPLATWGYGDPSQPTVNAEFTAAKHIRGTLSAARDTDTNSANSQFFICVAPAAWLNGVHSVYGRVVSGMNFVDSIVSSPRDTNDNPLDKIEMFISYVGSNDTVPAAPVLTLPASGSYTANTSRLLKWNAQTDGIIYRVEVATDSLFNNIVRAANLGANQYSANGLTALTQYFWRVKTNNGGHFSNYSEVWNFYISAVGLKNEGFDQSAVKVSPNPSEGLLLFENIALGSTLEIRDVEGKLIFQSEVAESNVSIDLRDYPKGVYFYNATSTLGIPSQGKIMFQ